MSHDSERLARAQLSLGCEPGSARVGALVAEFGAEHAVSQLQRESGGRSTGSRESAARRALETIASAGGRFVIPDDLEWPTQLDDLGDEAPFGIWVRGVDDLRLSALRSVSVVGARAATDLGMRIASSLSSDVAQRGWTVVSGGAFGIDAAAHRGALAVEGSTIAVLACGVDVAYPSAHEALFERCAAHGLIISEAPPGEPARRWRFLDRNRVIAALTRGTVVVEAAHRSGALSTARCASDLGRAVMGVPGSIASPASAGVHQLLRSGGIVVTSADEVIAEVGGDESVRQLSFDLVAEADTTLRLLSPRRTSTPEELARRASLPVSDVLADLAALELAGVAECTSTGWRIRSTPRVAPRVLD